MSLEDWRDVTIVIAGWLTILVLLSVFIFTVVVGISARALLGTLRTLLREEVTPLVHSVRETVKRVQGTAAFISESAVTPIIRVYGVYAGARRLIGVLSSVAGRRNRRR